MGNQNCSEIYNYSQQNQAYGDYTILKSNNKTVALIEKTLQNDEQLKEEVRQKLQVRLKLKSNHLVKLQKYQIDSNKFSTQVKMHYELIGKSLQDKYKQKLSQQGEFSERQLFNIIYGVENALEELNSFEIRHGCINLTTILCQSNFYKITDVSSTTFVKSYDLVRRGCRNQFLSEKLLTNLEYRSLQPYYEIEDDLFSLGMIILTLTSKAHPQHFYQWKEKQCTAELKWDNVENSIKKIQRTYSSKLSKKVKELIGFAEEMEKSLETNSTTANHNPNLSNNLSNNSRSNKTHTRSQKSQSHSHNNLNQFPTQLGEITHSINELDKDIDRILSRVNITSSIPKTAISQNSIHPKYQRLDRSIVKFSNLQQTYTVNNLQSNHSTLMQIPNQEERPWKSISFRQDKKENSF